MLPYCHGGGDNDDYDNSEDDFADDNSNSEDEDSFLSRWCNPSLGGSCTPLMKNVLHNRHHHDLDHYHRRTHYHHRTQYHLP